MFLFSLIFKSLKNRAFASLLTILSIALSISLLFSVDRVLSGIKESFSETISQTDLIVGAKGGSIQLLLYSVFHLGSATNNISYHSYKTIENSPSIEWAIPFSLGDSYKGFRVVGTNHQFYQHYHFHKDHTIKISQGKEASNVFDVVLGADVVEKQNLKIGDHIVLTHGIVDGPESIQHKQTPFTIVGILQRTHTPVDKSLYITLEGMDAIHMDLSQIKDIKSLKSENIEITEITSFLLRSKNRLQTLQLQRDINNNQEESLLAIIPAATMNELWSSISYIEDTLKIISIFVVIIGLIGMLVALYTSLEARRREIAILRALGFGPWHIFALLVGEAFVLTSLGIFLGFFTSLVMLFSCDNLIDSTFGISIPITNISNIEWIYTFSAILLSFILGCIPGIKAYKNTLSDGLAIRL